MFGAYRFILALLVVKSHTSCSVCVKFNLGVWAVTGFFLLTGYVMTHLVEKTYQRNIGGFYADRFLRIFPQYLAFLLLGVLIIYVSDPAPGLPLLSMDRFLVNVLLIPINFGVIPGFEWSPWIAQATLIPPAWSLGLEFTFYLMFPFLLFSNRIFGVVYIASILVFILSVCKLINPEAFGYRLLPGTLFIFLTGSLIYKLRNEWSSGSPGCIYLLAAMFFLLSVVLLPHIERRSFEVMSGFAINMALLYFLSGLPLAAKTKRMLTFEKMDKMLGWPAYGIFLGHFSAMWVLGLLGSRYAGAPLMVSLLAILFGYIGYFAIDRNITSFRHRIRRCANKG